MPLCIRHTDAKDNAVPHAFGWWHIEVFRATAMCETFPDFDPMTVDTSDREHFNQTDLYTKGRQVITRLWKWRDPSDGEVFILRPGEVIEMWYSNL
jgi:hypothetical protein